MQYNKAYIYIIWMQGAREMVRCLYVCGIITQKDKMILVMFVGC